jgi:hypothetical protein
MRKPLTLTVDAWGNVIVARTLGDRGTFVAKLDKDGNVLWEQLLATEPGATLDVPAPAMTALTAMADDDRDSVEPLMIDPELEELQRELAGPSRLFRGLGIAAVLAGLFAFGIAGGAAMRHQATSSARPTAAATGIRGAFTAQAERAIASRATDTEEETPTVDDRPDEDVVTDASTSDEPADPAMTPELTGEGETVTEPALTEPAVAEPVVTQPVVAEPRAQTQPDAPTKPRAQTKAAPPVGAAALRQETLALLNSGEANDAATMALQLVAAAPSDAFSYLCLGAAHQAAGRIAEAATAYRTCISYAKHGDVDECRALAR